MNIFDIYDPCDITKLSVIEKDIFSFAAPLNGDNNSFENQYANYLNDCADSQFLRVSYSWFMKSYKKMI